MQSIVLNAGVVVLVDALVLLRVGLDEVFLVEVLVVLLLRVVVAELGGKVRVVVYLWVVYVCLVYFSRQEQLLCVVY